VSQSHTLYHRCPRLLLFTLTTVAFDLSCRSALAVSLLEGNRCRLFRTVSRITQVPPPHFAASSRRATVIELPVAAAATNKVSKLGKKERTVVIMLSKPWRGPGKFLLYSESIHTWGLVSAVPIKCIHTINCSAGSVTTQQRSIESSPNIPVR